MKVSWDTHSVMLDCGSGSHTGSTRLWDGCWPQHQLHIIWGNKNQSIILWPASDSKASFYLLFLPSNLCVNYCPESTNTGALVTDEHNQIRNQYVSKIQKGSFQWRDVILRNRTVSNCLLFLFQEKFSTFWSLWRYWDTVCSEIAIVLWKWKLNYGGNSQYSNTTCRIRQNNVQHISK